MSRLFSLPKVPVFLEHYAPGVEKRRGEEVAIITLRLRVQPFTSTLATSLDDGVGGDSNVRATVFSLATADPKPYFTRHDFELAFDDRQLLTLYASSDTVDSRIAIDQVRISKPYVRTAKNTDLLSLIFRASFGPVSREELEYVHAWVRSQRAVTFTQTESNLDFDEEDEEDASEVLARAVVPSPMFDDPRDHPAAGPRRGSH